MALLACDDGARLEPTDLQRIIRLVYERSGITLHEGKRALILARLQKRVAAGGFESFKAYLRHVEQDRTGAELATLLDAIATNHTSFFREEQHFEFLRSRVLAPLANGAQRIRMWSAACSTGEEPITMAVTACEALAPADPTGQSLPSKADLARVRLLASDLSGKALAAARRGVYRLDRVATIPLPLLRKYFERGLGEQAGLARVCALVRGMIEYRQANLLDISHGEAFDVIFCRNVMIYFDRDVQQRVVSLLERHLAPGGYLFVSHSESLNGITHGLRWVAPAVYQRES